MRIGINLSEPKPGPDALDALREQIAAAHADGFASAWMANIFGLDALTALAVAGHGIPIELGTAVVPTYPRHPAALAQQALTAQTALAGRLVLGIGLSHQVVIEGMYGYSFDRPARHMSEYLDVLLPLVHDGAVSFHGELYDTEVTLSTPGRPLPVVLAALAPRMLALAGSVADGTVLWMTGRETIADHIVPKLTAAATAAGRPEPRVICTLPVCVTDDVDAATARAAKVFSIYGQLPSYRAMLDREGAAGPADVAIIGTAAEVAAEIRSFADAGVTDFVAANYGGGTDAVRTRELLGELAA